MKVTGKRVFLLCRDVHLSVMINAVFLLTFTMFSLFFPQVLCPDSPSDVRESSVFCCCCDVALNTGCKSSDTTPKARLMNINDVTGRSRCLIGSNGAVFKLWIIVVLLYWKRRGDKVLVFMSSAFAVVGLANSGSYVTRDGESTLKELLYFEGFYGWFSFICGQSVVY